MVNKRSGAAVNLDGNSCGAGTIVHAYRVGSDIRFETDTSSTQPSNHFGVLKASLCGPTSGCLNDGSGRGNPPSRHTEHVIAGEVKLASCSDPSAARWRREELLN